jgi:high affinity Mn2+ porin
VQKRTVGEIAWAPPDVRDESGIRCFGPAYLQKDSPASVQETYLSQISASLTCFFALTLGRIAMAHCRTLSLVVCTLSFVAGALAHSAELGSAANTPATITAPAEEAPEAPSIWNLHGQITEVEQAHPAFSSRYQGTNSLSPGAAANQTTDATIFLGLRLGSHAALYADPEIDQGFGLDNTLGMADFPSGAAYKVGALHPYFRLPRAFFRTSFSLNAEAGSHDIDDGPNQLGETLANNNVVVTIGKISVPDIFDANIYAHDPRADFMNWGLIDSGAFDYAADAWGFTYGGVVEWTQGRWTWRNGVFALSKVPNSKDIDGQFKQFSLITELEERHTWGQGAGKMRGLVFVNRGRMGNYDAAINLAGQTGAIPDTSRVRRDQSRPGVAFNLEQALTADLGIFARASWNTGNAEAFEFTEINRSIALGLSLNGADWGRPQDTLGSGIVVSGLSAAAQRYFSAGGLGILIGDGQLNYGAEAVSETYYAWRPWAHLTLSADYQWAGNPAYNRDRGPVSIFSLRAHAEF